MENFLAHFPVGPPNVFIGQGVTNHMKRLPASRKLGMPLQAMAIVS